MTWCFLSQEGVGWPRKIRQKLLQVVGLLLVSRLEPTQKGPPQKTGRPGFDQTWTPDPS